MKRYFSLFFLVIPTLIFAANDQIETIVIIRHAEKPFGGLGQLTCKGLNRSLALPAYFKTNFGKANYIFAPNPGDEVRETAYNNARYSYVRPLATIEPTAIALGLPVNTEMGYTQVNQLTSTLLSPKYHNSLIYIAWEHKHILKITNLLFQHFQNKTPLPTWSPTDYSKVFVFTIDWTKKPPTLNFRVTNQNIHHLSNACPNA